MQFGKEGKKSRTQVASCFGLGNRVDLYERLMAYISEKTVRFGMRAKFNLRIKAF